jgi:uncharacterized protein involved in exopolysaccharide biosynthesis
MTQFGSLADILNALYRRLPVIVLVTAIGCVVSIYLALQMPRVYETTALVQLEDARVIDVRTGQTDAAQRLQLIEQRMMARDNLVEIIEDYGLYADSDLSLALKVAQLREAARITAITDASQPWAPNANPTGLIITVALGDPQQAADVANELLARVVATGTSRQVEATRETLEFFRSEEARLTDEIITLEEEIAQFKQTYADALPAAIASQRVQLTTLAETDLAIERQIIELRSNARTRTSNDDEIALLERQREVVRNRISEIEARIATAPQVEQELSVLTRGLTLLQDEFSVVTRRRAEAETSNTLQANQQTERFEVLETALVPEFPVSRSRKKTAAMGGVASLIVGIGAALLLELRNPAIRTAMQLERALGVQAVVSIPRVRSDADRRRRNLSIVGLVAALLAIVPLVLAALRDRVEGLGFFRKGERHTARP